MVNKNNIFLNPKSNFQFSKLRGLDLQELLVQIDNLYLTYRDTLNLPTSLTFGVEIEYEKCDRHDTTLFVDSNLPKWISKDDGSLSSGGEIASPILNDQEKTWKELKTICEFLKQKQADTLHRAGGHIHIGISILGSKYENWRRFLKIYAVYESIIYRFVYGDKISARRGMLEYARPTADLLINKIDVIDRLEKVRELEELFNTCPRRQALNFKNADFYRPDAIELGNTLEFRSPNGTCEEVIWQNNINALTKTVFSATLAKIDEDFLNYKLKNNPILYKQTPYMYNEVCLKNALEFVDIVFDNNLDKVYFLKQYLKGFEDNYGLKYAVMAKKMVK